MIKSTTTTVASFTRGGVTYQAPAGRWYKTIHPTTNRLLVVGDWREAGKANPPVWQEGISWEVVTFYDS